MASSIVVASGKGGVGKTSLAVNLGLTLARQGRRTVLLDADFGMANAHILIGANPKRFIMDAIQGDATMADVLCDAPHGMKFISGGSGLLDMLNLDQTTRYQMIRMVDEISDQSEVLIADVPAGASDSSIAFVAAADRVVVVLVGEPTSFLDAYSLIKAANLEANVRNFSIVVNMARSAATRFLDVSLTYAGHLPLSERMRRAVVARRPISMDQFDLPENQAFMQISKSVLNSPTNNHGGIRFFMTDGGATALS
jgi:flagellar biosynthesis protein FlhG